MKMLINSVISFADLRIYIRFKYYHKKVRGCRSHISWFVFIMKIEVKGEISFQIVEVLASV